MPRKTWGPQATQHATQQPTPHGTLLRFLLFSRADTDDRAGSSIAVKHNGKRNSDGKKFLFFYEKRIMSDKTATEKVRLILCHLEGAAFDFYYDT